MKPIRLLAAPIVSGRWPDTGPAFLNRLASELDPTATPACSQYRPDPYPRPFNIGGWQ